MDAGGYVVTRPYPESGIGSNLASLAGALWLARELDRSLIVDWRGMVFLKDPLLNYFGEFLEVPPEILDVPIFVAPSVEAGDHLKQPVEDVLEVGPEEARTLLGQPADVPRYLVLTPFHPPGRLDGANDILSQLAFTKNVYRNVQLREPLRQKIEDFWDQQFGDAFVVGLNVATGNGAYARGTVFHNKRVDTAILDRDRSLLRRLEHAYRRSISGLPRPIRERCRIFFATDSAKMDTLLSRLPGAVSHRTIYPPLGSGRYFADFEQLGHTDRDAAADIAMDMFLLARCQALIRNFSMYSYYATVVTDHFHGNLQDVEALFPVRHLRRRARRRAREELLHLRSKLGQGRGARGASA